jgi:GGDEF domain-containing protein
VINSGLTMAHLVEAVRDGRSDTDVVALEVGASAAQQGVPLHEVLNHVERAHAPDEPAFDVVRAVAVAWAETMLVHRADQSCEDPLTSLATVPYLRSRLTELCREADRSGRPPAAVAALVVVELSRTGGGHALEQSLRALEVAEVLRTVFTGEETVAQLSPRRFAVLARRDRVDVTTSTLLVHLLGRALGEDEPVRLWVEHLPGRAADLAPLLASLTE